mgnify:CR=1 FL=1
MSCQDMLASPNPDMKTKGCMYVVKTASGLTNLANYQTEFSPSSTMYAWTNAQIDIEHLDKLSKEGG